MDKKNSKLQNRPDQVKLSDRLRSYFHPAQVSFTIAVLIIFPYLACNAFTLITKSPMPIWITKAVMFTFSFLGGLGGLVVIIRDECVERDGQITRGCWPYVFGSFWMLFGWGLFAFFAYFTFFVKP
jgi:hypothetical protein